MSLSEFDKQTVELVPNEVIILRKIELPQYEVQEPRVSLEYMNKGNIIFFPSLGCQFSPRKKHWHAKFLWLKARGRKARSKYVVMSSKLCKIIYIFSKLLYNGV